MIATSEPIQHSEAELSAWLADRSKSVGASEAPALVGKSPWMTQLSVYMAKAGQLPPERKTAKHLLWGQRFQPTIAAIYSEETGRELSIPPLLIRRDDAPWMHASIDYTAPDRPVEIKRVSPYYSKDWGPAGSDEVPEYVYLQVQQQMFVGGYEVADVGAFIGWDDLRIYTVPRNQPAIDRLVEIERDFMDRVARLDPPLPDFQHPTTAELLALIEPEAGRELDLGDDAAAWADQYQSLGKLESDAKAKRQEAKAKLLHAMGTAERAYLPDGRALKRKLIERAGYTVEPTEYVDFRIQNPKARKGG